MSIVAVVGALALGACGEGSAPREDAETAAERALESADSRFARGELDAYFAFVAVPETTAAGRRARARLARADGHYRRGIRLFAEGDPDARRELQLGADTAPMNPLLYRDLARACRAQGQSVRAIEYFRKYLALFPNPSDRDEIAREVAELGPELDPADVLPSAPVPTKRRPVTRTPPAADDAGGVQLVAIALGVIAAALGSALILILRRRRGLTLAQLTSESPELHPSIAYLVGVMRHELLKHRIGAIGDAVRAIRSGSATAQQRAFLYDRLYGGEPLERTWEGHIRAFERAVGPRLDLRRRDAAFRRGAKAVSRLASLEPKLRRNDARAAERLATEHAALRSLDAELSRLVRQLVRTRVDRVLLEGVVASVREEYEPGRVTDLSLEVTTPDEAIEVEVFRVDLVLVLKNVVRNALLALGRSDPPRRLRLKVETDLLPTGEEVVRVRAADTSHEMLTTESVYDRRIDRGLGLVTAALARYDAAITVEPGRDGYVKEVVVRFFRALDDAGPVAAEPPMEAAA
ncbi:MAG: hypothetical protein IT379_08320 [Deltaproteobacteria bacterium]|nr:hypothetical protein [Deltaproteobacteria bacterium]